ncbi:MAG: M15 family metallopeptidase [Anaerococcus sp.]|nr:M15 family metallopeptidase [Anaerococcus sp.]
MSNRGIRELKRKKRRAAKKRRKKIFIAGLGILTVFSINYFTNQEDDFTIGRPSEYRQALGASELSDKEKLKPQGQFKEVASRIGFEDVEIPEGRALEDDGFKDYLQGYIICLKTQYAYQYPNDYSKTEKYIKEGDYLPYYGSENGFSKIKIDDSFYYVNRYGLAKLDENADVKVINGIAFVNESYPLPENFNPGLDKTAYRAFETMRQDMQREGLDLKIGSDYRDYDLETKLYESGHVDSDFPSESEHQLGLAFDFFTKDDKYSDKFQASKEYKWLSENSYKYGFIERYAKGKEELTGHAYTPWHFRFVGVGHAKEIYDNDLTLEEYLKIR